MNDSNNRLSMLEYVAHVLMGYFCGLFGLHLLLTYRERNQLPPENNRYPVVWVSNSGPGPRYEYNEFENSDEYWSEARVMDTLNDSREYVIGYTLATLTHIGLIAWLFTSS